jgi:hypothetical protein
MPRQAKTTFKFDDNCFFLYRCVSAADQMQFFADAPLSPNMRTQIWNALWRPIRKRDLLNNSQ